MTRQGLETLPAGCAPAATGFAGGGTTTASCTANGPACRWFCAATDPGGGDPGGLGLLSHCLTVRTGTMVVGRLFRDSTIAGRAHRLPTNRGVPSCALAPVQDFLGLCHLAGRGMIGQMENAPGVPTPGAPAGPKRTAKHSMDRSNRVARKSDRRHEPKGANIGHRGFPQKV